MIRYFLILFLFCNALTARDFPIAPAFLKNRFQNSGLIHSLSISFALPNNYEATYGSEGLYWHNKGKFQLQNGILKLSPLTCAEYPKGAVIPCSQTLGVATCTASSLDNHLEYLEGIQCVSLNNHQLLTTGHDNDTAFFYNLDRPVPVGSSRTFDGHKVVILAQKAVTTDAVKIRKSPNVAAESFTFSPQLFSPEIKPFVPKDTEVYVYARTTEKQKVQNWENYWYLVRAGTSSGVWMYAEFVQLK